VTLTCFRAAAAHTKLPPCECSHGRSGMRSISSLVIAGLDPTIHEASLHSQKVSMDHRDKPGDDEIKCAAASHKCTPGRNCMRSTASRHCRAPVLGLDPWMTRQSMMKCRTQTGRMDQAKSALADLAKLIWRVGSSRLAASHRHTALRAGRCGPVMMKWIVIPDAAKLRSGIQELQFPLCRVALDSGFAPSARPGMTNVGMIKFRDCNFPSYPTTSTTPK
jgi:hypothetical protein